MNTMKFTGMPLNRASNLRKNSDWLQQQRAHSDAKTVLYWRGHYLLNHLDVYCHQLADVELLLSNNLSLHLSFLGLDKKTPWFFLDVSSLPENDIMPLHGSSSELIEFRTTLPKIAAETAAILGFGKALNHWHRQSLYCGLCGANTKPADGGHVRRCIDEKCGHAHFPRTDPAVIMLVEHQPKAGPALCLLAQHAHIPSNVFSTLAGFVDPGESLEEAVAREVMEEAGIKVSNINYVASQPWPFPGSIMLGFTTTANDTTLNIDYDEISGAKWFSAKEIRQFDDWGDIGNNHQLPRKESISRQLIDGWLAKQSVDCAEPEC